MGGCQYVLSSIMRRLLTRKQISTSPLRWKSGELHQAGPGTDRHGIVNRRWYITYFDPVALDNGL